MREKIGIFRGKDTIEHKWRYGNLTVHGDTAQIWEDTGLGVVNCLVDPETVGEFTGMTDKDGTGIFEGDIIKYEVPDYGAEYGTINFGEYGIYNIGFYISWLNNLYIRQDLGFWLKQREIVIVGNIHDNPELLKGADNDEQDR